MPVTHRQTKAERTDMPNKPPAWYGRHKVMFWTIACLVILYTLAGFVATPLVVRHLLADGGA